MAFNPIVDEEKCAGCEECVDVCPVEVFEMQDGKSVAVNAEECLGCESCVEVCEEGAIVVEYNRAHVAQLMSFSPSARAAIASVENTVLFSSNGAFSSTYRKDEPVTLTLSIHYKH